MRCYNLKAASAISACLLRDGPIPCALAIQTNASTPSGIISVSTGRKIRDCASIICCSVPNWRRACAMLASIAGSATDPMPATTRRPGSSWIWARHHHQGRALPGAAKPDRYRRARQDRNADARRLKGHRHRRRQRRERGSHSPVRGHRGAAFRASVGGKRLFAPQKNAECHRGRIRTFNMFRAKASSRSNRTGSSSARPHFLNRQKCTPVVKVGLGYS